MTDAAINAAACIHACQEGCGRPIDVAIIQIVDASTLMYCIPCFQQFAYQMMRAMVEAESPDIQEVVSNADFTDVAYVDPDATGFHISGETPAQAEDEFTFDGSD